MFHPISGIQLSKQATRVSTVRLGSLLLRHKTLASDEFDVSPHGALRLHFVDRLPENAGEDSVSFIPLLKGQDQPLRTHSVSSACDGTPSLRQGPWKLVFAEDEKAQTPVQLYNLDSDLGETKNVAATQPTLVAEMREMMEQFIIEGRTTVGARQKNDVKVRRYPRPKPALQ